MLVDMALVVITTCDKDMLPVHILMQALNQGDYTLALISGDLPVHRYLLLWEAACTVLRSIVMLAIMVLL